MFDFWGMGVWGWGRREGWGGREGRGFGGGGGLVLIIQMDVCIYFLWGGGF